MSIEERMAQLEQLDNRVAGKGTLRLRQVSRAVGEQLKHLVADAPAGDIVEIGTGGGYSTLWLLLGTERPITTYEMNLDKVKIAQQTFAMTATKDHVALVTDDATKHIVSHENIAFCFLDSKKSEYAMMCSLIIPQLVQGGLLVIDNVNSHGLDQFMAMLEDDERVSSRIDGDLVVCTKN